MGDKNGERLLKYYVIRCRGVPLKLMGKFYRTKWHYYMDQYVGLLERNIVERRKLQNANASIDKWAYLKGYNSKRRYKKGFRS